MFSSATEQSGKFTEEFREFSKLWISATQHNIKSTILVINLTEDSIFNLIPVEVCNPDRNVSDGITNTVPQEFDGFRYRPTHPTGYEL